MVLSVGMRACVLTWEREASSSFAAWDVSGSSWVALQLKAMSIACFSTLLRRSSSSGDPFGAVVPRLGWGVQLGAQAFEAVGRGFVGAGGAGCASGVIIGFFKVLESKSSSESFLLFLVSEFLVAPVFFVPGTVGEAADAF